MFAPTNPAIKAAQKLPAEIKELFFGPEKLGLGLKTYLKFAPKEDPAAGIRQIQKKFETSVDQFSPEAEENKMAKAERKLLFANYEKFLDYIRSTDRIDINQIYEKLGLVEEPGSESHGRSNLLDHLREATGFARSFLLTSENPLKARFPLLLGANEKEGDRRAGLVLLTTALHDALKKLALPEGQVHMDHEVLLGQLITSEFAGKKITFGEHEYKLTRKDVKFLAALGSNHEGNGKDVDRTAYIFSKDPLQRSQALFSIIDVLSNSLTYDAESDSFTVDQQNFTDNFGGLCGRHLDPANSKYNPQWISDITKELLNTFNVLEQQENNFKLKLPGKHANMNEFLKSEVKRETALAMFEYGDPTTDSKIKYNQQQLQEVTRLVAAVGMTPDEMSHLVSGNKT